MSLAMKWSRLRSRKNCGQHSSNSIGYRLYPELLTRPKTTRMHRSRELQRETEILNSSQARLRAVDLKMAEQHGWVVQLFREEREDNSGPAGDPSRTDCSEGTSRLTCMHMLDRRVCMCVYACVHACMLRLVRLAVCASDHQSCSRPLITAVNRGVRDLSALTCEL